MNDAGVKVAINTAILYLKMFFSIGFSFFTVRLLLQALGVEEFGIYTLIGGIITLFSFLNSAMTVSTQRFLSVYQGSGDIKSLTEVFNNSLILHIIIGFFVLTLMLILLSPIFDNLLNISEVKLEIAKELYCAMAISSFFAIVVVPYRASVISHENLFIDSLFSLIQTALKFFIAILLFYFIEDNKLYYFGIFCICIGVVDFSIYYIFCNKNYKECKLDFSIIKTSSLRELASFAGWNLYTNICYVLNTQGFNVLFNYFYGTAANAAYGIAFQVNSQLKELSMSLLRAITPQIMKSEGMTERSRTIKLSMLASKFGFFLVSIAVIPCLFTMDKLLYFWLGIVPENAVVFTVFFLISTIVNQLTIGIAPAIQAIGNIRRFQLNIGTVALFTIPLSYLFLINNMPIYSVFWAMITIEVTTGIMKIYFFHKICKETIGNYIFNVIVRMLLPFIITIVMLFYISYTVIDLIDILLFFLISSIIYTIFYYFIGLTNQEKDAVNKLVIKVLRK